METKKKSKKKVINSVIVDESGRDKYSLHDLNISIDADIDIAGLVIPLKMDIAKIDSRSANIAMSFLYQIEEKPLAQSNKAEEFPSSINLDVGTKEVVFGFEQLHHKRELDELEQEESIKRLLKFVNFDIIDFDNIDDLYDYLYDEGFDTAHFTILFASVNYWIYKIIETFRSRMLDILNLKDVDGKSYNMALLDLKSTYEHGNNVYYSENRNKANSEWSFREVELNRSYWTKKTMIDNAINKIDTPKNAGGDTNG